MAKICGKNQPVMQYISPHIGGVYSTYSYSNILFYILGKHYNE
jgi:hypothetical protein